MREEEYLEKAPRKIEDLYEEGTEKMDIGEEEEGEEKLQRILDRDDSFVPALNKLAVLRIRQDRKDEARDFLRSALRQDPDFPPALTNMGNIIKEEGNKEKAVEYYEKAIELNEEYGPAYNNLGVIKREEGELKESVKYLKKARKHGTFSFKSADNPMYKDPGCLVPIAMVVVLIIILFFWVFPG